MGKIRITVKEKSVDDAINSKRVELVIEESLIDLVKGDQVYFKVGDEYVSSITIAGKTYTDIKLIVSDWSFL